MPPIRLGDGTTVAPKGFSEVRKGDGTILSSGNAIPDSVVSRPTDNNTASVSSKQGLEIEVKSDWPSIGARLSANVADLTSAYLADSTDTVIQTVDITGLVAGDTFNFNDVNLVSGNKYLIYVDAGGASFTYGSYSGSSYPYTSTDVDITGIYNAGTVQSGSSDARMLNDIGNVGFN